MKTDLGDVHICHVVIKPTRFSLVSVIEIEIKWVVRCECESEVLIASSTKSVLEVLPLETFASECLIVVVVKTIHRELTVATCPVILALTLPSRSIALTILAVIHFLTIKRS